MRCELLYTPGVPLTCRFSLNIQVSRTNLSQGLKGRQGRLDGSWEGLKLLGVRRREIRVERESGGFWRQAHLSPLHVEVPEDLVLVLPSGPEALTLRNMIYHIISYQFWYLGILDIRVCPIFCIG